MIRTRQRKAKEIKQRQQENKQTNKTFFCCFFNNIFYRETSAEQLADNILIKYI